MMTSRNDKFFMGKYRSLLTAAAILYGAFAAQADYSDENIATTDDSVRRLEVGGKSVYVFTNAASAHTATVKREILLTDYLVAGGGGGGGNTSGGGGGAGGVTNVTGLIGKSLAGNDIFTVSVGAGGAGSSSYNGKGANGKATSLRLGDISVSIAGGGGGGSWFTPAGVAGASGGGGTKGGAGGAGIDGIGYAGATAGALSRSGGGGGAGHAGYQYTEDQGQDIKLAGNGGEGIVSSITGEAVYYGGGGGGGGSGGGNDNFDPGFGGLGGGGDGEKRIPGHPGADGFGGGGGGGGWANNQQQRGGNGGSGTVILAFKPSDFNIDTIPPQTLVAGGARPEPVVRLAGDSTVLTKDVHYEVTYTDNDALGTALMTVTGIGTYVGKVGYAKFLVVERYYAKSAVDVEGDGLSWATAMSVTNFFATFGVVDRPCEVWIAAGTVSAQAISITNNAQLVIRGGFAGTETSLDERAEGALTVFDGERTATTLLKIDGATDSELVIDHLKFCNARANGFIKSGGGSLQILGCVVEANGRDVGAVYGRGMNVQSDGLGSLVVKDSVFAGNRNLTQDNTYGGFGIYIHSFASAVVDDSLFVTNGYDLVWPYPYSSGYTYNGYNARGSAIWAENAPITVRNSRFAGNVCPVRMGSGDSRWAGGVIALSGSSGGSLIDHCTFIGNSEVVSYQAPAGANCCGALVVNLANATDKVKVNNCTLAYNVTHGQNSAGGITVVKGDVEVDNSILWKNTRLHVTTVGYGSDVQVQSTGSLSIKNSLVTTLDGTGLVSVNPDNLVIDTETVIAADPRLVTSTADFTNLLTVTASQQYYKSKIYDDVVAMDAHLKSPAGYVVNGGAAGPATTDYSPAIDLGDPAADYSNEPAPNGGRLNLGAFGNTAEASSSATGQPEANVEVTFPDGMTRPKVTITMGLESGDAYSAVVQLYCTTGGVLLSSQNWSGVGDGDVLELFLPYYLTNGDDFRVLVMINAPNAAPVQYQASETVDGNYPPFYGKGGGPNVIHVRTGANCKMDGTSWTDAYPDLGMALNAAPGEGITEIWLAVTNDYMTKAITLAHPLTIRGGFTGVENSVAERPEGDMTWLDGNNVYRTMDFAVSAGALLTVERIHFAHSSQSELKKTGSGNLIVRDCIFTDCKQDSNISGQGLYASGGTIAVTNCNFVKLIGPREHNAGGGAITFDSCTAAYVDSCLFATNGAPFCAPEPGWSRWTAAAIYVKSTPTTISNSRFAACCAVHRVENGGGSSGAGIVSFTGASSGSKMINCVLVGNTEFKQNEGSYQAGNRGGAISCEMTATNHTLDVENCTIAYNLTQGYRSAAGINVYKGTVNLKNSIVYGNVRGRTNIAEVAGADIDVKSGSTLNVSYSLLTGTTTNYLGNAGGNGIINIGAGMITNVSPLLVTTEDDFTNLFAYASNIAYLPATARGDCAELDVHPRTHTGYYKDGVLIKDRERVESPTIDAGDPASDYMGEPMVPGVGYHGRRVNLGAYGNTPEAALTPIPGFILRLR